MAGAAVGEVPTAAVGMGETDVVRRPGRCVRDDGLFRHRLASDRKPLFPLAWALWFVVGEQEEPAAQRAAAVLLLQQTQVGATHRRGWSLAAPLGPVVGQGRVVR